MFLYLPATAAALVVIICARLALRESKLELLDITGAEQLLAELSTNFSLPVE